MPKHLWVCDMCKKQYDCTKKNDEQITLTVTGHYVHARNSYSLSEEEIEFEVCTTCWYKLQALIKEGVQ